MTASNLANESREVAGHPADKPSSAEIAQQLIALGEEDQRDRKKAMTPGFDEARLAEADRRREAAWLEITSGRLLGVNEVGAGAVSAQFLILQHSGDRTLQAEMARQMQELVDKGDFPKDAFATFTDRQLVYDGKPQRFGTQANEYFELYPIEDESNVDKRRESMGLPPIAELRAKLQQVKKAVASGKGLGE
ncbi:MULTISPECIES: DUF6624 domain-containing protein [Xanthomonas]|uniref:DUF6624 domain-containing protein n=1 Tax=Xanthomonas TaxID=338 RepID=UPI001E597615|nr:DUF6624 domain-containing protein [Xanthomonas campestris]MCC5094606.1 hypothetical protein [Xanthomonas campestris pv. incanae]MEA9612627.1 DUF6624 domain-containing protein [Xanthomonas campestris pv. incanae]